MIKLLFKFLGGGALDRILDTVDAKTQAGTDREKLRAEIIKTHYQTRGDFMRTGGFWLMMMFAAPLAFWFASVLLYSVFWHSSGPFPQTWDIAALPPPLEEWAAGIVAAIFLALGADRWGRK